MKATKAQIITDLSDGTQSGYVPALIELSKQESITGKIAYACGRSLTAFDSALKHIEKARVMILESKAMKEEDGKTAKVIDVLKQDGTNEDGSAKMVPALSENGSPMKKYAYETEEKERDAITTALELLNTPVEVNIYKIPASEIMQLKSIKDGGMLIFNLGDIIDHEK